MFTRYESADFTVTLGSISASYASDVDYSPCINKTSLERRCFEQRLRLKKEMSTKDFY